MHDRNGTELKVGDTVVLVAKIKTFNTSGPDYCNVTIESVDGRRPDGYKEVECLNTGVLTLLKRGE